MKFIISLLALSAMCAAEVSNPPQQKPEMPDDVKAKMEEIHQLREAHQQAMKIKTDELKVILQKYPKLGERILKRIEARMEDRKENKEERKEDRKEHHHDK